MHTDVQTSFNMPIEIKETKWEYFQLENSTEKNKKKKKTNNEINI